ncbi:hypothetical protein [Methylophilus sp.]|uniref:hypothetical protein n=1 Tax=Methylophilus sp. TaxID=29541 RepID=UPI004036BDB1
MSEFPASSPELIVLRDQIFRAVGKSTYLYQQIEKQIKFLNASITLELTGPQNEWPDQLAKHQSFFNKQTMGTLMRWLLEGLYFTSEDQIKSQVTNEMKLRWRFSLQTTAEYVQQRRATIDAFVDDRNRLVHHYFENIDFADASMLTEMVKELEAQHEKINEEIQNLNQIVQLLSESSQVESEWWASAEGARQWETIRLQNSTPINFLEWYSGIKRDRDGWAVFQTACDVMKKQYMEEVDSFFNTFKFESLQSAATASALFEFTEEKTTDGERLLYRAKATDYEYTTSISSN